MPYRYKLSDLIWLQLYVALLAAVVGGLVYGRQRAFDVYGTEQAQTQWDQWRDDAKAQSDGQGPVNRRAPQSGEPPALVLMRDYFGVCVVISVALSSVLFAALVIFIRGAWNAPAFVDRSPPEA